MALKYKLPPDLNQKINDRGLAREVAQSICQLMQEELVKIPEHARTAFFSEINARMNAFLPEGCRMLMEVPAEKKAASSAEPPRPVPMTASEVVEFEKELVPLSNSRGRRVAEAEARDLQWIAGLDFIDRLRRYLANEYVGREIEREAGAEE